MSDIRINTENVIETIKSIPGLNELPWTIAQRIASVAYWFTGNGERDLAQSFYKRNGKCYSSDELEIAAEFASNVLGYTKNQCLISLRWLKKTAFATN